MGPNPKLSSIIPCHLRWDLHWEEAESELQFYFPVMLEKKKKKAPDFFLLIIINSLTSVFSLIIFTPHFIPHGDEIGICPHSYQTDGLNAAPDANAGLGREET